MKPLIDFQGRPVRLTDERRQHILEHPEMAGMESALAETRRDPQLVIRSRTDETATLNYRYYLLYWLAASGCALW
jgi:2-methylisocitrate lyase-like PEP mutase family enzyme